MFVKFCFMGREDEVSVGWRDGVRLPCRGERVRLGGLGVYYVDNVEWRVEPDLTTAVLMLRDYK